MRHERINHYINGAHCESVSGKTFANINPATGRKMGEICEADDETVERAICGAVEGLKTWGALSATERGRILLRASQLLRERNDSLANREVLDTGKPIAEAICVDVQSGADALEYFAGVAATLHGHHYDLGASFAYTRREPLGVVAGLGAWNYPLQIACWKAAPALACGNTMIFKPSELTPMTAVKLAEIFTEAGLPPGVFNVIHGAAEVGKKLTNDDRIAKVSLTGEVTTGKKVMAAAATSLKHVTFELGGKSPLIILDDADLTNAVSGALMANFYTQGEICSNGTRVYVARGIYDRFVDSLVARSAKMVVGNPLDTKTQVGALISEAHYKKVLSYIESGKKEGAKLLCGGDFPESLRGSEWETGYFLTPAVFGDCTESMRIVQEEIFGPVMSVLPFDCEEDVIERANATPYGLAGGVFTKDVVKAHRFAKHLQVGICWINNYNVTPVQIPFGGYKQSGIGRENSLEAVQHYTQIKTVYVEGGDVDCPY